MNLNLGQKITACVIVATVVLLGAYDVVIWLKYGESATISWEIWTASIHRPALPFAAGWLCGHLFGQFKTPQVKETSPPE